MRPFGSFNIFDIGEIDLQDLTVKKQQGTQGHCLCGGGNGAFNRQMRQVGPDFWCAHVFGMAFAVKQDEVADVVNIGLLGLEAEVPKTNGLPDLIQQAEWRWRWLTIQHKAVTDNTRIQGVII